MVTSRGSPNPSIDLLPSGSRQIRSSLFRATILWKPTSFYFLVERPLEAERARELNLNRQLKETHWATTRQPDNNPPFRQDTWQLGWEGTCPPHVSGFIVLTSECEREKIIWEYCVGIVWKLCENPGGGWGVGRGGRGGVGGVELNSGRKMSRGQLQENGGETREERKWKK